MARATAKVVGGLTLAALAGAGLMISPAGVQKIERDEGRVHTAYPDPGTRGVPWTICVGSTSGVRPGMVLSDRECDERLIRDIRAAEAVLKRTVRVRLSQPEWDAYTSFVFNVGAGSWSSSTLLRKLNAGDRPGACAQLTRWVYAGPAGAKRKLPGLVKRRDAEYRLCMTYNTRYIYDPNAQVALARAGAFAPIAGRDRWVRFALPAGVPQGGRERGGCDRGC